MAETTAAHGPAVQSLLFSAEHEIFRDSVRAFARDRLADGYLSRARSDRFPRAEARQLAEHGLLDLVIDESRGGQGGDPVAVGIACEEVAWADINVAYLVFGAAISGSLLQGGLPDPEPWLGSIGRGERVVVVAVTEPDSGSDAAAMRTRAEPVEGGWILNGEKTSVTQGPHADAAIVFTKTDPKAGPRGISAFLVPLDDPTVSRQVFEDPGFRPMGRGSIKLEDTFVPRDALIGEENRGFHMIMREFDWSRTLIGLGCIGAAQRAIDLTIAYTKERRTFGEPIASRQGVHFPIAEHLTYLEAARALCYQALALRRAGRAHTAQAAMVKWWVPQVAVNAINDCTVLHGHPGYSEEMPLQALHRDVSAYQIADGTPQIQKMIVAREAFGRAFVPGGRPPTQTGR